MSDAEHFKIRWIDRGREPQCAPDPTYPNGKDLRAFSMNGDDRICRVELPYPAKRCGLYEVECTSCGLRAIATTAGRPDDPRSLTVSCKARVN